MCEESGNPPMSSRKPMPLESIKLRIVEKYFNYRKDFETNVLFSIATHYEFNIS